jgi:hypothetical protein
VGIIMIDAVLTKSQASGTTRLIAIVLARTANDGGYTFRSVRTIAEQAGVDERTAQRCIRKLVDLHELRVSIGTGPKGCNEYWLVWGAVASSDAPPRKESSPRQDATPDDPHPWQSVPKTPGNLPPESTTESKISRDLLSRWLSPGSAVHRLLSDTDTDTKGVGPTCPPPEEACPGGCLCCDADNIEAEWPEWQGLDDSRNVRNVRNVKRAG